MEIPKIDPNVLINIVHSGIDKSINKYKEYQNELNQLDESAKKAMIKMAEKNWVERNPFLYGLLMALIGAVITAVIEKIV
jgi:hypothetical protein